MKICNELLWIHIQLGIISNWGYTHTGANCQMVVTCCHLGIPLRQMLLQLRIRIQLGILSNWGYTHTGANCQTVVTWCHLGIPLHQMLLQLQTHIQQAVLSNWGYAAAVVILIKKKKKPTAKRPIFIMAFIQCMTNSLNLSPYRRCRKASNMENTSTNIQSICLLKERRSNSKFPLPEKNI